MKLRYGGFFFLSLTVSSLLGMQPGFLLPNGNSPHIAASPGSASEPKNMSLDDFKARIDGILAQRQSVWYRALASDMENIHRTPSSVDKFAYIASKLNEKLDQFDEEAGINLLSLLNRYVADVPALIKIYEAVAEKFESKAEVEKKAREERERKAKEEVELKTKRELEQKAKEEREAYLKMKAYQDAQLQREKEVEKERLKQAEAERLELIASRGSRKRPTYITEDDPYWVLGVNEQTSPDEVRRLYQQLSRVYHPDKCGGNDREFKAVALAYSRIKNPESLKQYREEKEHERALAEQRRVQAEWQTREQERLRQEEILRKRQEDMLRKRQETERIRQDRLQREAFHALRRQEEQARKELQRQRELQEQRRRQEERERSVAVERERQERLRQEAIRQAQARRDDQRRDSERTEHARAEQERKDAERRERHRMQQEQSIAKKQERERAEQARRDAERKAAEQHAEREREDAERREQHRMEQERKAERKARECAEQERKAAKKRKRDLRTHPAPKPAAENEWKNVNKVRYIATLGTIAGLVWLIINGDFDNQGTTKPVTKQALGNNEKMGENKKK